MPAFTLNLQEDDGSVQQVRVNLDPALPHHRTILTDLQAGQSYEPDVAAALGRILKPGDVFVDVGANIGFLSLLASARVGPNGRVICFEPGVEALEELRANVALNARDNVMIIPKAASDSAGQVEFFLNRDDIGGSALWDPARYPTSKTPPQRTQVESVRLDVELPQLLGEQRPRLIKIDTEGAELLVLRGTESLLGPDKIPAVICEMHEFGLNQLGMDSNQLRAFMAEKGYETFMLSRRAWMPMLIPPQTHIKLRFLANLMFTTREMIEQHWPIAEFQEPY